MTSDYRRISEHNVREYGEGTRHLAFLGTLYSVRTHFIFELLQNAEDAQATQIAFKLLKDRLEVSHDGRPFSERDVRGVCGVGESTKTSDLTAIGKFGIGFKSVYAYTRTPEIHSGDEHFRVQAFVRPSAADPRQIPSPWTTLQVFPFDREDVGAEQAFNEIGFRLAQLGARTLLFLRQIMSIEWSVDGWARGTYLREDQDSESARRVKVIGEQPGATEVDEDWLMFRRPVECEGARCATRVEVAFRVQRSPTGAGEVVTPVRDSQLVVFFPTEKETHLGFLMQGPYRTTPARDNIPSDDPWNRQLVEATADLVVTALHELKSRGLLTVSALETLPLSAGHFTPGSMFRPIYDAVRVAMRDQPLLPTHDGDYVAAKDAKIARGAGLLELFSGAQLATLFGRPSGLHWLTGDISEGRPGGLYRYLIGQEHQYYPPRDRIEPLVDGLEGRPSTLIARITPQFLAGQDDLWVGEFYAWLGGLRDQWPMLKRKPILRLEDGQVVAPFLENDLPNAYLPPSGATSLPIVKRSIVANEAALKFLLGLGLEEPDAVAEVLQFVLPKYPEGSSRLDRAAGEPEEDLRRIVHALTCEPAHRGCELRDALASTRFVFVRNHATGRRSFVRPREAYLPDSQYDSYFRGNENFWSLAYEESILSDAAIVRELEGLGVARAPRLKRRVSNQDGYVVFRARHGDHARGRDRFDPDCSIDGLEHALAQQDRTVARYIWNSLLKPNSDCICGIVEHSGNKMYVSKSESAVKSPMGRLVTEYAWLPSKSGTFRCPEEMGLDDLPDGFEHDELLAKALGMRSSSLQVTAREIGVDPALLLYMKSDPEAIQILQARRERGDGHNLGASRGAIGEGINEAGALRRDTVESQADNNPDLELDYAAEFAAAFNRPSRKGDTVSQLPVGPVRNPALRRLRAMEDVAADQAAEPSAEERFRRVPTKVWEAKDNTTRVFLANQYGGRCQICDSVFERRNGGPYFEGLYIVPSTRARWPDRPGNVLCLCATCCAKFQHGTVEAADVLGQLEAYRTSPEGGVVAPVLRLTLCGESAEIRFTEAHILDSQALLRAASAPVLNGV